MKKTVFVIIVIIGFQSVIYASNAKKTTIAILDLSSSNVEKHIALFLTTSLTLSLKKNSDIQILERHRIKQVIEEQKIKLGEYAKLANLLSADFFITGVIEKYKKYRLTVKIIDCNTGEIIATHPIEFESLEKHSNVIDMISKDVALDLKNYNNKNLQKLNNVPLFYYTINGQYTQPIGDFSNVVNYGVGINFMGQMEKNNLMFSLNAGFNYYSPKTSNLHGLKIFPFLVGVGYKFEVYYKKYYITPYAMTGLSYIIIEKEEPKRIITYTNADFTVRSGVFFGTNITYNIMLEFDINYSNCFEEQYNMNSINFSTGIKYMY